MRPTPRSSATPPRDDARAHVAAWERSGLSARAYAVQHGLRAQTLYSWRRRLRASTLPDPDAPRLVPIQVDPPALFELVLRDGHVLRCPIATPPAAVAALVRALEAP